jgi:hypothetical protein
MMTFVSEFENDVRGQVDRLVAFAGTGTAQVTSEEVGRALEFAFQLAEAGWGPDHPETRRLQILSSIRD